VVKNGGRLGQLLCDADLITKRQLAKAIQRQVAGDKRKLGEILIELSYITIEDLTNVMLDTHHAEQQEEVVEEKVVAQPIDISQDAVMKTKFALDLKTIIAAAVGISSLVGMWYALQADIQEAKELPKIGNIYDQEYPSRPEGYNWPRSYEQYKDQVGSLQEDMDSAYETIEEMEDLIKEMSKEIRSLEKSKKDK
jgi:hypothetical protein